MNGFRPFRAALLPLGVILGYWIGAARYSDSPQERAISKALGGPRAPAAVVRFGALPTTYASSREFLQRLDGAEIEVLGCLHTRWPLSGEPVQVFVQPCEFHESASSLSLTPQGAERRFEVVSAEPLSEVWTAPVRVSGRLIMSAVYDGDLLVAMGRVEGARFDLDCVLRADATSGDLLGIPTR